MATPLRQNERYSDFYTNFDPHPVRGDLLRLTNEEAVKRSIKNLMFTAPYERRFQPDVGAGLPQYLFENIDSTTEFIIREKIIETIRFYEPRANVVEVYVNAMPDDNAYTATIVFTVLSNITPVTLDLILTRVR